MHSSGNFSKIRQHTNADYVFLVTHRNKRKKCDMQQRVVIACKFT